MMAGHSSIAPANGKASGFDNEADFIPFDLSDGGDDDIVDTSRPASRASHVTGDSVAGSHRGLASAANGDGRKRKRTQIESSPERGPPAQRPRLSGAAVNPWHTNVEDYAALKETARMYTDMSFRADCRLHKEVEDFSAWISPTSEEHDVRAYVVKRVVNAIESALPQCRAHPFGSFSTKLYGPDAYVDLFRLI